MIHVQGVLDISVRVSRVGKRDENRLYSPENQEEVCRKLIEQRGFGVGLMVSEVNVSGGKAADQRGLEKLIQRVERGESAGIVVADFSRLTREEDWAAMMLIGRIHGAGGVVLGAIDGFDSSSPAGTLQAAALASASHGYLKSTREKSLAGMASARERGAYTARTPFGYDRNDDGTLSINEYEAETARAIFAGKLAGQSYTGLWQMARNRGHDISESAIRGFLMNPAYIGKATAGPSPRIVEDETFAAVQSMQHRRPPTGKVSAKTLCQGLALCANCGSTLIVGSSTDQYHCRGLLKDNPCPKGERGSVKTVTLDAYVEKVFLGAFEDGGSLARAYHDDKALHETEALLKQAINERQSLLSDTSFLAELGSGRTQVVAAANAKVEMAKTAHAEAQRQADALSGIASMVDMWRSGHLSLADKRRLLRQGVERVEVGTGRVPVETKTRIIFHGGVVVDAPHHAHASLALV